MNETISILASRKFARFYKPMPVKYNPLYESFRLSIRKRSIAFIFLPVSLIHVQLYNFQTIDVPVKTFLIKPFLYIHKLKSHATL